MSNKPTMPRQARQPVSEPVELRFERITIRQLSQLPVIDMAALDPAKRQAEEARRRMLLAQAEGRKEVRRVGWNGLVVS